MGGGGGAELCGVTWGKAALGGGDVGQRKGRATPMCGALWGGYGALWGGMGPTYGALWGCPPGHPQDDP